MKESKLTLSDKVGYITIGSLITQFGRIVTAIIVARFVTKDIYGTYNQMFLIYGVFSPIFLSGIPGSILYFYPLFQDAKKRERFISQTISLLFIFGIAYSIVIFATAGIIAKYFNNPDLAVALRIFSLYPILNFIYSYFQPLLVAKNEVKKTPIFFTITAVANLLFMAVAVYFFPTPVGLAWASVFAIVPPLLYITIDSRKYLNAHLVRFSLKNISSQLKYSFPLGLAAVIGQISYQVDRIIISVKFTPAVYAIYAVGAFEMPVVALIGNAVNSVLVPEISAAYKEGDKERIFQIWKSSFKKMAVIVFPLFVIIFILADLIVPLLFSAKYNESVPLFRIYLLLMPLRIASYGLILRAIGKTKVDLYASLYYLVGNTALNIVLVNVIGLWGPAIGTVISTFSLAVFYVFNIKKYLKIKIRDIVPFLTLAKIMVISVVPGIILYFLNIYVKFNINIILKLAGFGLIYFAVYSFVLIKARLLSERDKQLISRWTGISRIAKIIKWNG